MAQFESAFEEMIRDEGGYVLHEIPGDTGGSTYAGIARNKNPQWAGWALVDKKEFGGSLTGMVRDFYRAEFWDKMRGNEIQNQEVAATIFNFGVNAGMSMAVKLAQLVVGSTPDGGIGPKTVEKLNLITDGQRFKESYALAKIARYAQICNADKSRTQSKFLLGWINRTLAGLK
jgi:lysozyme family protein